MDFNSVNRGSGSAARPAAASQPAVVSANGGGKPSHKATKTGPMWLRIVWIVLLFAATLLVVAIVLLFSFGSSKESDYIDDKKQQAVFLTNGQVYFGDIKDINKQYIDLQNIYYLNVNQQVQPNQKDANNAAQSNSVSLVKLGCELHGPVDQMIINREQVTFWENLKDDGQVAEAIAKWVEQNPEGQKCQTPAANDSDAEKP